MQRWASRGLLAAWLLYSAGALGWFLAQDPLLSLYPESVGNLSPINCNHMIY